MNLKQVYMWSCLTILVSAATIKTPSEINRQKRTIQYFWDGLFSVLKDRLPMLPMLPLTARTTVNDHRASTLVSIAKLSSTSTPNRNVQYFDDDDDIIENTLNLNNEKPPINIFQMPIPSIASTLLTSTENRILQPMMTKRVELDVNQTKQSSTNSTSQVEKTVSKISTTVVPKQVPMTTVAPINVVTLNQTQTVTIPPNDTQTTTTTTTATTTTTTLEPIQSVSIEPDTATIKPNNSSDNSTDESLDLTTLDPLELAMITIKNLSSSDGDGAQTKMEKRNAPMKLSNLHTTQFFDGPLLVESDQNAQHKPIYLDDNCIETNCNNGVIQPRNLPNSRIAPVISMQIALPVSASDIDQRRRQNGQSSFQNYNIFTLHTHIPIYTDVSSKRLSNEIIDPPTVRKAQ